MIAMLSMTLLAVGAAVAAWLRPVPRDSGPSVPPTPTPAFTDQQIAEAKANVCAAFKISKSEVAVNSNKLKPTEGEYIDSLILGTLARFAAYAAGGYLLDSLIAEPATPNDLSDAVRSLGNSYKNLAMHALNDDPSPTLDPFLHAIDNGITHIDEMCR